MATFTTRPVIMGRRGVVTSGHYLVTSVGLRILMNGGNAIDAAAAMGICETLLEPQSCGIGGEVPNPGLLRQGGQDLRHLRHGVVSKGLHASTGVATMA